MKTVPDPAPARPSKVGRAPAALFVWLSAVLILAQVAPVAAIAIGRGIWPLHNFEDYSTAFWAPLKVGYVPSYYFNQSGFYFGGAMKWVHALTDWIVGSKEVSLHHMQVFGYASRGAFALLTLGVVAIYWRRRPGVVPVITATALLLSFQMGTPFIAQLYHLRVGLQLSYVLFALLLALAVLEAMARFLENETPTRAAFLYWGFLSGATLLEAPHFVLFALPLLAVTFVQAGSLGAIAARAFQWGCGALGGLAGGIAALYGSDLRSAAAAVFSNFRGIVAGFPQPQPGFEAFPNLRFDPSSDYFWVKVAIVLQVAALAVFAASTAASWRRQGPRFRAGAWVIVLSFAINWIAHLHVWKTHGSYTTVFSIVYCGFLTAGLIFQDRCRARAAYGGSLLNGMSIAAAIAAVCLPIGVTVLGYPYVESIRTERAQGEAFRSFNDCIGRFPGPLGLLSNRDISYLPLIAHCNFSRTLYHMGSSVGFPDGRFAEAIQRDRYPDFRLIYDEEVIGADYDFRKARLNGELRRVSPVLSARTVLVPLSAAEGGRYLAEPGSPVRFIAFESGAPPAGLALELRSHPDMGVAFNGSRGWSWSIAPLRDGEARTAILRDAWPAPWGQEGFGYYLVSTPLGYYLLGLPVSEHAIAAPAPAAPIAPPRVEPRLAIRPDHAGGYGFLTLDVLMPRVLPTQAEPLLTTGEGQAGDVLYIVYADSGHIRIGFDHWSEGGPLSPPIGIDYSERHRFQISMGSLFPRRGDPTFGRRSTAEIAGLKQTLMVKLDGIVVFNAKAAFYESPPGHVAIGENPIRASTCAPSFSGSILGHHQDWP